ncbi:MAG: DNA helicase RecG, partial [Dolichospermum sp.]
MTNKTPDWIRLHKALAFEAENGFIDLVGKQHRFSEFLSLTFGKFPLGLPQKERSRWQEIAMQFANYPNLALAEKKDLVAEVRKYLNQLEEALETKPPRKIYELKNQNPTTPIVAEVNKKLAAKIDQELSSLPEIGIKKAASLARLDLHTVRDLLFYYPRDHIDYARQVNISELTGGETVTIIGTVKRFNFFTSPKNKKLSILELILKDNTGQIKVSRFFAGARFTSRGWQETLKRNYPVGSTLAACGLVKGSKYGLTLDNPELEVLANPGDAIDSLTIGRVVPIYSLTEGVVANTVRQSVMTALTAAVNLKDPLPKGLREKYDLMELKEAIPNIHFPKDSDSLKIARRRLVFDEFFYL